MTTNTIESEVTKHSSDDDVVLSVQGVSKKFCRSLKRSLFYGVQDIASELVGVRKENNQLRKGEFWALQDVSFELRKGESLGLVGANGSGKTTLLRIISGLIKPDTGSIKITGRVAPLIALGAGFNPILTGRENIYVNMSILGLSKEEIDDRFDEVVDFAEIGDAIDAPIQTYSSGMAARLGFACAIHTEPDILLIDEVLAVGDAKFQGKCSRKLGQIRKNGASFILVAHNPILILSMCEEAIYLLKGNILAKGLSKVVVEKYEDDLLGCTPCDTNQVIFKPSVKNRINNTEAYIEYLCFKDKEGNIQRTPNTGEEVYFCIGCKANQDTNNVGLAIILSSTSQNSNSVLEIASILDGNVFDLLSGLNEVQIRMPILCLNPGNYSMKVYLVKLPPPNRLDFIESFRFSVKKTDKIPNNLTQNLFYQPRTWNVLQSITK